MKLNFNRPLTGIDRQPVKTKEGDVLLVSNLVCKILFNLDQSNGKPLDKEVKLKAWRLFNRIGDSTSETEISVEEAAFLKDACGDYMSSGAYGQLCDIIENVN